MGRRKRFIGFASKDSDTVDWIGCYYKTAFWDISRIDGDVQLGLKAIIWGSWSCVNKQMNRQPQKKIICESSVSYWYTIRTWMTLAVGITSANVFSGSGSGSYFTAVTFDHL